jgi:hypothetical protein
MKATERLEGRHPNLSLDPNTLYEMKDKTITDSPRSSAAAEKGTLNKRFRISSPSLRVGARNRLGRIDEVHWL